MKKVMRSTTEFCQEQGIRTDSIGNGDALRIGLRGTNGQFLTYATSKEDEPRALVFRTFCPITVSQHRRAEVAEAVVRANLGVFMGRFDYDIDEGQISFTTSVICGQADLDPEIIKHLLFANWSVTDRLFPVFSAVAFGTTSTQQTIEQLHSGDDESDDESEPETPSLPHPGGRLGRFLEN